MLPVSNKIKPLIALENLGGILCHGCFDVIHIGHIRHLQVARALAPKAALTVTITADQFIRKGVGRPIFDQETRAEVLAALALVDFVAIVHEATGLPAIETIKPQYYVKGKEYQGLTGDSLAEAMSVMNHGGKVFYTDRWASSTDIVERITHATPKRA